MEIRDERGERRVWRARVAGSLTVRPVIPLYLSYDTERGIWCLVSAYRSIFVRYAWQ